MKRSNLLLWSILTLIPLQIVTAFGEKVSKIVRPLSKMVSTKMTVDPQLKACNNNLYDATVQCLQWCVHMDERRQYEEPRERTNCQRKYNDLRQDLCGTKARSWDRTILHKK